MTRIESALSTIFSIFDELNGIESKAWQPHPRLKEGACTEARLHRETSKLCATLQQITDIRQYSFTLRRWWLEHQIADFKRLQRDHRERPSPASRVALSSYEQELLDGRIFLRKMVADVCSSINSRFEAFSKEGNPDWQRNITRHSFTQLMSTLELFSELLYHKLTGKELEDYNLFKYYDSSEAYWRDVLSTSYSDWLLFQDQFDLRRYFEKFRLVTFLEQPARNYFTAVPVKRAESEHLIFTISDCTNLVRIIQQVTSSIIAAIP